MRMTRIDIDVPEDILLTLNESKSDFARDVKKTVAVELFRSGRLSMGKAAEFAGMTKGRFFFELGTHGVAALDYDEDDFREEIERSRSK